LTNQDVRQIGPLGTAARQIIGALLLVFGALGGKFVVIDGHFKPEVAGDSRCHDD
jgi:hypothetical protein